MRWIELTLCWVNSGTKPMFYYKLRMFFHPKPRHELSASSCNDRAVVVFLLSSQI